ncbi:MAG: peptidase U32 family protein, partial [Acholeplasmataceae bacterium]
MKKVELLAPAGHKDALIGAINAGADAIYLAGKRFGARAYANNFSDEELIETIDYAHVRGVRVFVAINTLVFDDEVEDLISYADFLVKHHVDALIVQDLGMIDLFVKRYPDTEIHVSTQFNTHNLYQVKMLKALGVKRIVLARETSIQTIKAIKKEVDIELEVFIHGALCVSYSGNCLMSSMIGGRSGNRGECAQPCRLPYQLYKDNQKIQDSSYLLSTKDLMTIDYIGELIEIGIDSFKIEGRMRKKEYVIETVKAYRHAIDQHLSHQKYDSTNDIDRLKRVFNREFTKGFVLNEVPRLINNSEFQNHLGVPLGKVIGYQKNRVKILLEEPIRIGDGYRILSPEPYG